MTDADKPKRLDFFDGDMAVPDDFDTMGAAEIEAMFDGHEYEAFLQSHVDAARTSIRAGHGVSNEIVSAEFAERRARTAKNSNPEQG